MELERFQKTAIECKNKMDWIFYCFKNLSKYKSIEDLPTTEHNEKLIAACELANFSNYKRTIYEKELMTDMDHKMVEMAIREEGIAKGLVEGEAIGIAKGKAEGKAEGRTEEKMDNALNLIKVGVALESIAVALGLSVEDLQKMKESLEN